ncbi:MAG: hypothetical protein QXN23_04190 [Candidatus Caldarchaeum sp.]|uniref:Uncharacterized protein n=2 Tax=Caldiarchaeum subterraneum TaxID=311458 RepID=A0A7C4E3I7_CALS0|nr:hypothetical protein [Candidatus Caldarchaeales archaeon]
MHCDDWFVNLIDDLEDLALESLTATTQELIRSRIMDKILINARSELSVDKIPATKEKKDFVLEVIEPFVDEVLAIISNTKMKLSEKPLNINLHYFYGQGGNVEKNQIQEYIESLLLDCRSLVSEVHQRCNDNVVILAITRGVDLLINYQNLELDNTSIKLWATLNKTFAKKKDDLNRILQEYSSQYLFISEKCLKKKINSSALEEEARKALRKVGEVKEKNINEFAKHFIGGLLDRDMDDCKQKCVEAVDAFLRFIGESVIPSQNLSEKFSEFFLNLIVNRRIFEIWVCSQIADLKIPVTPPVNSSEHNFELDFVAFYDGETFIGDVTTTSREDEMRLKLGKLMELEKQGFKPMLITITDYDKMLEEGDYSRRYILNVGGIFDRDLFKRKFLRRITTGY